MTNYTLSNEEYEPYISIYDNKPKKKMGRPKTCTLTDEEKKQRKGDQAKKLYYDNYEYRRLQIKLYQERIREENKI